MGENTKNHRCYVFISYSSENKNIADAIVADLEQHGIRCWYAPRDIMPGKPWMGSIVEAIKNSEIVVLVYTEESNKSQQVMREMTLAFDSGKTIIPFKLTATDMNENLSYFLAGVHWMDAITPPLNKRIIELREKIGAVMANSAATFDDADQQSDETDGTWGTPYPENVQSVRTEQKKTKKKGSKTLLVCLLCATLLLVSGIAIKLFLFPTKPSDVPQSTDVPQPAETLQLTEEQQPTDVLQSTAVSQFTDVQQSAAVTIPAGDTLIDSGAAGDHSQWQMYSNGVLEITGTGKMNDCEWDYEQQKAVQPWDIYHDIITSAVIGDGINYIGECSFRQCSGITSVYIPKSVTSIGWCAFTSCGGIREFIVDPDNPAYCSVDGVLFNKAMTKLLIYPADKPGDTYTVPDGVTEIDTFASCDLKTINMPDSVTKIGGSAFAGCDRIEEIVLPPKLSEISSYLFWGCDRLKKVTIQENVEYIANDAFFICRALTDINYTGTEEQWNEITIGDSNDELKNAAIHFLGGAE